MIIVFFDKITLANLLQFLIFQVFFSASNWHNEVFVGATCVLLKFTNVLLSNQECNYELINYHYMIYIKEIKLNTYFIELSTLCRVQTTQNNTSRFRSSDILKSAIAHRPKLIIYIILYALLLSPIIGPPSTIQLSSFTLPFLYQNQVIEINII